MRKRMIGLLSAALIPAMTLLGAAATPRSTSTRSSSPPPARSGSPIALGMEKFAEIVEEKSGGKITVKRFPGGTLGGDVQTISALQGGTVEMTTMNAGILASVAKDFAMVDLPFLFDSPKQADAVMDGPVGTALAAELPEKGLVGLGYWELGFRQLTNNRHPITKVDDIDGLKIRVIQSPIYIDLFNALGANAVPMPFTELYTALETGAIDGQENPAPSILTAKLNEVQKYMTLTNHTYNPADRHDQREVLGQAQRGRAQACAGGDARGARLSSAWSRASRRARPSRSSSPRAWRSPSCRRRRWQVPREGQAGCRQVCRRARPRSDAAAQRPARRAARQELSGTEDVVVMPTRNGEPIPAHLRGSGSASAASGAATRCIVPTA